MQVWNVVLPLIWSMATIMERISMLEAQCFINVNQGSIYSERIRGCVPIMENGLATHLPVWVRDAWQIFEKSR